MGRLVDNLSPRTPCRDDCFRWGYCCRGIASYSYPCGAVISPSNTGISVRDTAEWDITSEARLGIGLGDGDYSAVRGRGGLAVGLSKRLLGSRSYFLYRGCNGLWFALGVPEIRDTAGCCCSDPFRCHTWVNGYSSTDDQ